MELVGADAAQLLQRRPLSLQYPDGSGLQLRGGGPPRLAFGAAVLRRDGWPWTVRLALLRAAIGWALRGFRCDPSWTVAQLCRGLPAPVRPDLIDPLCVAALNTPSHQASASVFLRVLRDALVRRAGRGRPAAAARVAEPPAARTGGALVCCARRAAAPGHARQLAGRRRRRLARRRRRVSTRSCWPAARPRPPACATPWHRRGRRRPPRCAMSRSSPSTCAAPGARLPKPMNALRQPR